MAYPVIVAVISFAFALIVFWQYARKHKPHQLVWGIALAMSATAAAVYLLALPPLHSQAAFRLYYWLGAVCMAAWLGQGSVYLVVPRRAADYCFGVLVTLSLVGAAGISAAPLDAGVLAQLNGGPGTGVLAPGPWLPVTILLNTFGVVAVMGVALYSAIMTVRRRAPTRFLGANLLIAAGALVLGIAGSTPRLGFPGLFWLTMSVGWVIIFAGFLLTLPLPEFGMSAARAKHSGATPSA